MDHFTVLLSSGDVDEWQNDGPYTAEVVDPGYLIVKSDGQFEAAYAPGMWMKIERIS